jgi:hypothetical protein
MSYFPLMKRNGVFAKVLQPLFPIAVYKQGIRMHNAYAPGFIWGMIRKKLTIY